MTVDEFIASIMMLGGKVSEPWDHQKVGLELDTGDCLWIRKDNRVTLCARIAMDLNLGVDTYTLEEALELLLKYREQQS